MEWDSPWGKGFPGWHTECVAMSVEYLGLHFDIHCGGEDHVPVHHVNEIAQAEACHGTRLAEFWMHGRFLLLDGGKMAKSTGEKMLLSFLQERGYDPLSYRFFCLGAHYRKQLQFAWDASTPSRPRWDDCANTSGSGEPSACRTAVTWTGSVSASTTTSTCLERSR